MKLERLVPMLPVRDLATSVDFYRKLGFVVEQRNDEWRWARLAHGECRLMLDESIYRHRFAAPSASVLYFYPDSIREYHDHLRAAGVEVPDLEATFYGMTEFRLEDPDGNRLWIGQSAANPR